MTPKDRHETVSDWLDRMHRAYLRSVWMEVAKIIVIAALAVGMCVPLLLLGR